MFVPAPILRRIIGGIIDYAMLMVFAMILAIIFGTDWRFAAFLTFVTPSTTNALVGQIALVPTVIFAVLFVEVVPIQ